jgi:diaminopimelate epimerase
MMVLHRPRTPGTDVFVAIYNSDGSAAGACGNGTRCVADVLCGETGRDGVMIETSAGVLASSRMPDGRYRVDMGRPKFRWDEIPLADPFHDTKSIELQVGPIDNPIMHTPSVVNVGNPHCIFWVDDVDAIDLGKIGPMLEHHRLFPDRANISIAQVTGPGALKLRVWERGAGLTLACGSAACAAAVAAARKKLTGRIVTVSLPGGPLLIEWGEKDHIWMTGPAEHVSRGFLDAVTLVRKVC